MSTITAPSKAGRTKAILAGVVLLVVLKLAYDKALGGDSVGRAAANSQALCAAVLKAGAASCVTSRNVMGDSYVDVTLRADGREAKNFGADTCATATKRGDFEDARWILRVSTVSPLERVSSCKL